MNDIDGDVDAQVVDHTSHDFTKNNGVSFGFDTLSS
jgi:hypothetical protein